MPGIAVAVLSFEVLEPSREFADCTRNVPGSVLVPVTYTYSSHRGVPGSAKNATACVTSLCISGKKNIGEF